MWHKSTVKYRDRKRKTVTEHFLHHAVSFCDVEAQLVECLRGRVSEYDCSAVARIRFAEVVYNNSRLPFYATKIRFQEGDDKTRTETYLIPAESPSDAEERIKHHLGRDLRDFTVEDTDMTKILGVWHPHAEIWKGDFLNRMEERKEEGKHTADINQLSLFNKNDEDLDDDSDDDEKDENPDGEDDDNENDD